jgi:MerR family transcriptional regulator, heat shock protein HspR
MKRKKGYFSISAVAKMFSVHQQTVRMYEKQGLISPKRSDGNTRLFSEEDIDRLELIIHLTHNLGINLAGVEMVLKLKRQIAGLKKQMNDMFQQVDKTLDQEKTQLYESAQSYAKKIKQLSPLQGSSDDQHKEGSSQSEDQTLAKGDWEVDYEEDE